jgi:hypothetical protein
MKAPLRLAVATFVLGAFNISAQPSAEFGIQTYAGLTLTGTTGEDIIYGN